MKGTALKHIITGIGFALFLASCGQAPKTLDKRRRVVTLYANDGQVIKTWTLDRTDNFSGGWDCFYIEGKSVKISGTIISEVK